MHKNINKQQLFKFIQLLYFFFFIGSVIWAYEYEYNFAKFDGTSVKNLKNSTTGEPKLHMGYNGNGNNNVVTKQGIMVRIPNNSYSNNIV